MVHNTCTPAAKGLRWPSRAEVEVAAEAVRQGNHCAPGTTVPVRSSQKKEEIEIEIEKLNLVISLHNISRISRICMSR